MRIGIFGAGFITRQVYLPLLAARKDVEIAGIFSRTMEKAQEVSDKWRLGFATSNPEALLDRKLDAAFVLTSSTSHFDIAKPMLEAGVDLFVEKPLTETSQKAKILADLADANKLILMACYNRRFSLFYQQAREMVGGRVIRLAMFEKHRTKPTHFGFYSNFIFDTVHQVDLLRYYCGEVKVETCTVDLNDGELVSAVASTRLRGNGLGVVQTCMYGGAWIERALLHGDGLSLEINAFRSLTARYPDRLVIYGDDRPGRWVPDLVERGFSGAVDHFLDCVHHRKQPETNGEDSVKTQLLVEEIVRAGGGNTNVEEIRSVSYQPFKK